MEISRNNETGVATVCAWHETKDVTVNSLQTEGWEITHGCCTECKEKIFKALRSSTESDN